MIGEKEKKLTYMEIKTKHHFHLKKEKRVI